MAPARKGVLLFIIALACVLLLPPAESNTSRVRVPLVQTFQIPDGSLTVWRPPVQSIQLARSAAQPPPPTPSPFPANITGTFKGEWSHLSSQLSHLLGRDSGLLVFRLTTVPSPRPGLANIQGDLVLRDGVYITENDVAMKVQGVYMPAAGRLTAVLEPAAAVYGGPRLQDADYGDAVRSAAKSLRGRFASQSSGWAVGAAELPTQCQFSLNAVVSTAAARHQRHPLGASFDPG